MKTDMTYDTWKATNPQDEELGPEFEQTEDVKTQEEHDYGYEDWKETRQL